MERHHQLKDIILLRYQYYPKWPIESMLFLSKFQWFLYINTKIHPKIHMQPRRPQTAKIILKKRNKFGGLTRSDFKTYLKATVIIKICIGQWNRKENPKTSFINGLMMFKKGTKTIQWRKDSLFNKWYWENWTNTTKFVNSAQHEHNFSP